MAAAARPPGISDARVPCPLCGGLIHPVAGRCKHCKEDLTQFRAGRPQAAAPLPALVARSNGNGHTAHAAHAVPTAVIQPPRSAPIPVALPTAAQDGSQPILPPRPTGRSMRAERPRSAWRSWPVLVIILAVLAIVTAVAILLWPQHEPDDKRTLPPPPAPERMSTDPMPSPGGVAPTPAPAQPSAPSTGGDPWGGSHSQVDPNPAPTPRSVPDPLPPDPPAGPDTDPFQNPFGGAGGMGAQSPKLDFAMSAVSHICERVKACPAPDDDDDVMTTLCESYSMFPQRAAPSSCAAAQRCIEKIDRMTCAQLRGDNPMIIIGTVSECKDAVTSC